MARAPRKFCEICGRQATARSARKRRGSKLPRGYAWCGRCGTLACWTCRREGGCAACVAPAAIPAAAPTPTVVPAGRRSGIPGTETTLAIGLAASLVVAIGSILLQSPAPPPTGAVLGLRPQATPVASGATVLQSPDGDAVAGAALSVTSQHMETWSDALGAWHGQAIARIRNDGAAAVTLTPRETRATITSNGVVVYEGAMDAAIPPVLPPGAEGYLVVGFPLSADVIEPDASLVPAATAATEMVTLEVHDARVTPQPGRTVVKGSASNPSGQEVREGVVGAIAIDDAGEPVAAFLDEASLGLLKAGETRDFEAADPPAPPLRPEDVADLVVVGWGRASGD